MNFERYSFVSTDIHTFEFISEGPKEKIWKVVQYSQMDIGGFNLAFGDKDEATGMINDMINSNNGDTEKVLWTIASTVDVFLGNHPDKFIYVEGSTKARTRLYRMGISKYLSVIQTDFEIYGEKGGYVENFRVNTDYESFLVKRKNLKLVL